MSNKNKTEDIFSPCEICGDKYGIIRWYNKRILCNDCSTKTFKRWQALSGITIVVVAIVLTVLYQAI